MPVPPGCRDKPGHDAGIDPADVVGPPPRDRRARLRYDAGSRMEMQHVSMPLPQRAGANSLRSGPDERGRFGDYGGRFVAETLMPLILEVERAYDAAKADPAFHADLQRHLKHYVGRPSPLWFAERLTNAARRREGLLQARRAEPHRQPQGQQLHGPDPAGPPHGQDAHHRRDRRRPARRRHRHDVRAVRPALHRLHGRHRRRAAEAQRVPHEAAGRRGEAGDLRRRHAEGRDERGDARLGRQCRATPTT